MFPGLINAKGKQPASRPTGIRFLESSHQWAPLGKCSLEKGTVQRRIKAVWALKALAKRCEFGLWEAPHLRKKPDLEDFNEKR
jgi:hypothetical protein